MPWMWATPANRQRQRTPVHSPHPGWKWICGQGRIPVAKHAWAHGSCSGCTTAPLKDPQGQQCLSKGQQLSRSSPYYNNAIGTRRLQDIQTPIFNHHLNSPRTQFVISLDTFGILTNEIPTKSIEVAHLSCETTEHGAKAPDRGHNLGDWRVLKNSLKLQILAFTLKAN